MTEEISQAEFTLKLAKQVKQLIQTTEKAAEILDQLAHRVVDLERALCYNRGAGDFTGNSAERIKARVYGDVTLQNRKPDPDAGELPGEKT